MEPKWGTPEWYAVRDQKLKDWLLGNEAAYDCLMILSNITETWDDLIDGDKEVSAEAVNAAFYNALLSLPNNSFYDTHKAILTPYIFQAITGWLDANKLEQGDTNDRALAYTLRHMDVQILLIMMKIVGGLDHLRQHSVDVWRYFGTGPDSAVDWINGVNK